MMAFPQQITQRAAVAKHFRSKIPRFLAAQKKPARGGLRWISELRFEI
jgi:hypothetical protein